MTGVKKADFIIIDDSALDCFIAEKQLKHSEVGNEIKSYLRAQDALDYIKESSAGSNGSQKVILLDVMMPIMNGIEFVEEFEKLPQDIQQKYFIVAFTSSMNKKDMNRIQSFDSVQHLFDKPLAIEKLIPVLKESSVID